MTTEIYIDVDGDGVPDYYVLAMDYNMFFGSPPNGQIYTFLFELFSPYGYGFIEYQTGNDPNTALQTLPISLDDLNYLGYELGGPMVDENNPTINYFVVTTDMDTGAYDITDTATYNVLVPTVSTYPDYFYVDAHDRATIDVLTNGKGTLLLLYYNNISGYNQAQILPVGYKFYIHSHHHH